MTSSNDFYLLLDVVDQYGNNMASNKFTVGTDMVADLIVSAAPGVTNVTLDVDKNTEASVKTVNGHDYVAIKLKKVDTAKDANAGTIGETSAIALIIGGVYLIIRKVISYQIPVFYIGTVAVFTAIYAAVTGQDIIYFVGAHIFGGGLLLGAFFMATDYVTSPITPNGKIVFGIILGLLTSIFRLFGPSAEGVSYAIIFSNLLVPLIERVTWPRAFGVPKGGKK